MSTFVLIPGAGGSAWVWSRVTPFLVEAGHDAIAVELPGDDDTAGLARYTELVVDAIGSHADVVIVAGSLGGFTAPLVCERVPVRELVLVNAMIPAPGETAGDWWANTGALGAQAEAARAGDYGPFDEATYFLHDVDPEIAAEGELHRRSQADIVFRSVCDFQAWPEIGIRVLAGHDDRFFPVGLHPPGSTSASRRVAEYLLHPGRSGEDVC